MMSPVILALIGGALLVVGAVSMWTGVLGIPEALATADRAWPVLMFVVSVSVVAGLAAAAGVFDLAAAALARLARGRITALWLFIVLLGILATAFLSLDTTAVLLTPVVVAVARANGLPQLPFVFTTVWLAHGASLALPVSNLTNLLAAQRLSADDTVGFLAQVGPSALCATVATVLLLGARFHRSLRGRYTPAPLPRHADRTLLLGAAGAVVAMLPLLVIGIAPWIPATCAAVVLVALFAWRHPRRLRLALIPWGVTVFASGLFLATAAVQASGVLDPLLARGSGGTGGVIELAAAGVVASNAMNNLPAYLALEPAATTPVLLTALLAGVNAGPLIAPWGSLATLLWHERLRAAGAAVPWREFTMWGLVAAPVIVTAAVLPLLLRG